MDFTALWTQSIAGIDGQMRQRAQPGTRPVAAYLDPALHQRELALLRRMPHPAALSSALSQPGDWLATQVHGQPVLLTRGSDGATRAFLNVCRHRGAALCAPGAAGRERARFVCPYHAWTYDATGACVGRPHEGDFPHVSREDAHLVELPCHTRLGLVWVIATARHEVGAFDWPGWFGPLGDELAALGYDDTAFAPHGRSFRHPSNWKLVLEGNLESYHFQYAHRQTIAHIFHDNLVVHAQHGDHQRIVLPKRSMAQYTGGSQDGQATPCSPPLPTDPAAMADLLGRHSHVIYYLFPSTFALWEGDHINLFSVSPVDTDHCDVHGWLLAPGRLRQRRDPTHWARNHELFWAALDEDFALAASIHSGLRSGANTELRFGTNEFACMNFNASLAKALGESAGQGV